MLANRDARRVLLHVNGLAPPGKADLLPHPGTTKGPAWALGMVRRLGFVQIDPICAIERAHHHILFSRNPSYKHEHLRRLLEQDRALFENWTHDAAILPVEAWPYWQHYMRRFKRYEIHAGYERYYSPAKPAHRSRVLKRIRVEGALRPRDVDIGVAEFGDKTFPRFSLSKLAMEYLWRTGPLAVAHRAGRQKVYDLAERVIPREQFEKSVTRAEYVDWAVRQSLLHLGFGTAAQIARCLDAVSREDAAAWCKRRLGRGVAELRVSGADGRPGSRVFALEDVLDALPRMPAAPKRLRLINPFDPLIHDRKRALAVFGFDYAIEIWVPASKRKYGYYVLPILEGDRFTGRLDAKVDRKAKRFDVLGLWWERGVKPSATRKRQLDTELQRLARFTGAEDVRFVKRKR
ncbi:MAG: winged helix-turn-helix domain-containing protein [bacterium]|nr:winged helix-turn-helix domain-containing protein [bacterium]